jgi:type IV secretory pathway VirD2 relaxase
VRSQRSILALRYTPVSVAGGVRRAVGGFIRYVQYRDQHVEPNTNRAVDAYVRYMAHRDRTSPGGRVFGKEGDADRRHFVDFVARSTRNLPPKWVLNREGERVDRQRAVYTFVLSPEDWRGLDLRALTRAAMSQLERDAGPAGLGPWFAAEHRNTAHHHVHVVLAARRELAPGRFSTLVVNRARLQRMKDAIALEIERQRGLERGPRPAPAKPQQAVRRRIVLGPHGDAHARQRWRWLSHRAAQRRDRTPRPGHSHVLWPASGTLLQFRAVARGYQRHMERELERELARAEREGSTR